MKYVKKDEGPMKYFWKLSRQSLGKGKNTWPYGGFLNGVVWVGGGGGVN